MTVAVIGDAGLGKTRLVTEFAGRLGPEVKVLTGRCLPYGEGITFWPLRDLVLQAGGHDSPERIKALVDSETDAASIAGCLHRAFSPGNQGRSDAAEIFWAARRFLEALARSRPLLVVFEDLHWAEPTFLDLVESLAIQPGGSPSSWSATPVRNCWSSVQAGPSRRTGPFRSNLRRSAKARRQRCSTL